MAKPMTQQPLPVGRHYYSRPTPVSLLFEENSMNSFYHMIVVLSMNEI